MARIQHLLRLQRARRPFCVQFAGPDLGGKIADHLRELRGGQTAGVFAGTRTISFPIATPLQTVFVWSGNITGWGRIVITTSTAPPIQFGASIGCTRYVTVLLTPVVLVNLSVDR